MNNHQIFEDATNAVERGWIKGELFYGDGVCLVGGLMRAQNITFAQDLDPVVIKEVDVELRKQHRSFRLMARFDDYRGFTGDDDVFHLVRRIEAWNDMPWRRKKSVVRVLRALADSQRTEWLQDERSRLLIKVTKLESLVHTLQERVARLEHENEHLWGRLRNVRQLQTDAKSLEYLESELAETQRQLATVS